MCIFFKKKKRKEKKKKKQTRTAFFAPLKIIYLRINQIEDEGILCKRTVDHLE